MGLLFNRKKSEEKRAMEESSDQTRTEPARRKDPLTITFEYEMYDIVIISVSNERGEIIGRAEREGDLLEYLVRYNDGNNCAVERWWSENAIELEEDAQ